MKIVMRRVINGIFHANFHFRSGISAIIVPDENKFLFVCNTLLNLMSNFSLWMKLTVGPESLNSFFYPG